MYDPIAIDTAALQAIGYSNPQQFFAPPSSQAAPPPEMQQIQAKMANETKAADAKMIEAKAKEAEAMAKIQQGAFAPKQEGGLGGASPQVDTEVDKAMAQAKLMDAQTKRDELKLKHNDTMVENRNRELDRQSRDRIQNVELLRDIIMHPDAAGMLKGQISSLEDRLGNKEPKKGEE